VFRIALSTILSYLGSSFSILLVIDNLTDGREMILVAAAPQ